MTTSTDRTPRPRVRVLHADPDKAPVLVIDRWSAPTADFQQDDVRDCGFSGVLVFSQDIDLEDDGLDDEEPSAEAMAAVRESRCRDEAAAVENAARTAAAAMASAVLSSGLAGHGQVLADALARLDAARTRVVNEDGVPAMSPGGRWSYTMPTKPDVDAAMQRGDFTRGGTL